jgi:CubicO group peptidase (beta-lactamase class C family)
MNITLLRMKREYALILWTLSNYSIKVQSLIMRIIFVFILFISAFFTSKAQNPSMERVKNYLKEVENEGFSGTVLVANKDEVLYEKGFAFANTKENIQNQGKTVYDIGSITKQFTAAAILKLEMQGRLSVDDRLTDHFSLVPDDKKDITLHHLLTHSSGLVPAIGDDYEEISTKEFTEKALRSDLLFVPGSAYEYSNVGYSLLGIIVEEISGQTYEEYLYQNLWKPVGMEFTGYQRPTFRKGRIATGYRKNGNEWGRPVDKKWGSDGPYWHLKANGGVLSNVEDMYLWHKALMAPGVLSEDALSKYFKPYVREGEGANSFYSYGWAIYTTSRGTKLAAHNGGNGIFFADFWRYLDDDLVIIVMSNQSNRLGERLAQQIGAAYFLPDFKANFSTGNGQGELDDQAVEALTRALLQTFKSSQPQVWEQFLITNATPEFVNMAPMDTHLEYFAQFHEDLKDAEITDLSIDDGECVMNLKTPYGSQTVIMSMVNTSNGLKFDGLMID